MGFMSFILIIIVAILVIYFVKKGTSNKKTSYEETVKQQVSFDELSQEEQDTRSEAFRNLMQGANGDELIKCYNRIKSLFIPKGNGEFAGSLSGLLSEKSRAKTLAVTDETVARILGNDTQAYAVWYNVLFDSLLNEMYFSTNGKLAQFTKLVIEDVRQGDVLLEQVGIADILSDTEKANSSTKVRTENATIKIETKTKNGELHYEIKGAYDAFKYGLCLDDALIRKAEILIAICAKYEYGPKYELHKDDVEKYALPNLKNIKMDN
jgi:hypothetical protein